MTISESGKTIYTDCLKLQHLHRPSKAHGDLFLFSATIPGLYRRDRLIPISSYHNKSQQSQYNTEHHSNSTWKLRLYIVDPDQE
jgi:hypothetical protein